MTLSVDVRANDKQVRRHLERVRKAIGPKNVARALNTARRKTQSVSLKEAAKRYQIKQALVRNRFDKDNEKTGPRVTFKSARANSLRVQWSWQPKGRAGKVAMIQIKPSRQRGQGTRSGKYYTQGGFIRSPRAQSGNFQVFKRRGRQRYPIDVVRLDISKQSDLIFRKHLVKTGLKTMDQEVIRLFRRAR